MRSGADIFGSGRGGYEPHWRKKQQTLRQSVSPIREKPPLYGIKETGEPIAHAICLAVRRTAAYCDSLKEQGYMDSFRKKTGLVIDAYFPRPRSNGC